MALTIPVSSTEALQQVRANINEPTADFWTDSDINSWVVEGSALISLQAHCVEKAAYLTLLSDTLEYDTFDSDITAFTVSDVIEIEGAVYDDGSNNYVGLLEINTDAVGREFYEDAGPPQAYCKFAERIIVMPITSSDVVSAGGRIRFYFSKLATTIADLPPHLQIFPIYYATAMAFYKRNKNTLGNLFMSLFTGWTQFVRADLTMEPSESRGNTIHPDIVNIG